MWYCKDHWGSTQCLTSSFEVHLYMNLYTDTQNNCLDVHSFPSQNSCSWKHFASVDNRTSHSHLGCMTVQDFHHTDYIQHGYWLVFVQHLISRDRTKEQNDGETVHQRSMAPSSGSWTWRLYLVPATIQLCTTSLDGPTKSDGSSLFFTQLLNVESTDD